MSKVEPDVSKTQAVFSQAMKNMSRVNNDSTKFFSQEYREIKGDAAFVNYLKSAYDFKSSDLYTSLSWNVLMPALRKYDRLQNSTAMDFGSHNTIFVKNFELKDSVIESGSVLDKKIATKLIEHLQLMLNITGSIDANKFMTQYIPNNEYDSTIEFYNNIKNTGKLRKGIIEDFVSNYCRQNEGSNEYLLAKTNIIRLIKQAYAISEMSKELPIGRYRPVAQAYLLTGSQGTGKSGFIQSLFDGHVSDYKEWDDPQLPQKRSSQPIFRMEEMRPMNKKSDAAKLKDAVTNNQNTANVKYEKDPLVLYNRSVIVGLSNDSDLLTDTTSGGENRRWLFIPFPEDTDAFENQKKVINFYKNKGFRKDKYGNYDVNEYYNDMQYTVLFTNEYDDVSLKIIDDEKEYLLNRSWGKKFQHMTDVKDSINDLLHSYIIINKNVSFIRQSKAARSFGLSNIDSSTELKMSGKDENEILSDLLSQADNYMINSPFKTPDLLDSSEISMIYVSDVKLYLKNHDVRYKSFAEVSDAMSNNGFKLDIYKKRKVFKRI